MNATGNIDLLGGDDDEERDNLNEDNLPEGATDFNPEEYEVAPSEPPEALPELDAPETTNTDEFKSLEELQKAPTEKQLEAQVQKEINALKREASQELAETKKELKKQFRREVRDEAKSNRREKKAINREATQRRKEIRSMATQNRIGTYSLASAFGAKGYVVASAIDTLVFRPQEEEAIAQERAYSDQVEEHFQRAEDELQQRKDNFEDDLDAMKPRTVDEDAIRTSKGVKTNSPPGTPGGGSVTSYNRTPSDPASLADGQSNVNAPDQTTIDWQQRKASRRFSDDYSIGKFDDASNAGGGSGSGSGSPPSDFSDLPIPPTSPSGGMSNIAGTAAMVTLAMEVGKVITEGIDKVGATARDNVKATFSDRPSDLIRQQSKNLELLEPVTNLSPGTTLLNAGLQESVDVFADAVDKFDQYSRKNLAFSPEALTQSIEGQLDRLTQSMEIAQRLDGQKARNIDAMDRLSISFEEFKARVFSFFEPFLTTLVNAANGIMILLNSLLLLIELILSNIIFLKQIAALWKSMQGKKSLHQTVIDRQEEFLNAVITRSKAPNARRNNP